MTEEIFAFADDFGKAGAKIGKALYGVFRDEGDEFARDWARNATQTAGKHGKHYPKSITSETKFALGGVAVEVGPETRRKQGGMGPGFEYGSRNQPPHLDGLRAQGPAADRATKAAEKTIEGLLP